MPRVQPYASRSVLDDVEMITGDAVALAVPPAPLGLRIVASLIDFVVMIALQVGLYVVLARLLEGASEALVAAALTLVTIIVLVAWPAGFETVSGGRSPGKLICGTRVVRDDGGPITFQHAFTRAMLGTVELYGSSSFIAFISALASRRHQRLGDRLAGTYVVRARNSWTPAGPAVMPAALADWAGSADLERIPPVELGTCRRFLARRDNLRTEARDRTARNLVLRIAPWVLPAPPAAADEDILSAIVAEHYRRERQRLQADAALTARLFPNRRPDLHAS